MYGRIIEIDSAGGTTERELDLQIALKLQEILKQNGVKVAITAKD